MIRVKGIIPPLVTPLVDNDTIDEPGLEKLLEYLIAGGVHGLFILGTTGESVSLSYETRKRLITLTARQAGKRVPVYAGITDTFFNGTLGIAEYAAEMGLDALVVAPPYYLPLSQKEFLVYLDNLAPRLPLPFLLYNMPACTKMHLSAGTIRHSRDLGSIGVKDSSGDISFTMQLIKEFSSDPGFAVITGTELHLPEIIRNGGHGAIAGGANIFPRLFVDLYEACLSNDEVRTESLMNKLKLIDDLIYKAGKYGSKYIKGIKCALSAMEICNDYVAMPLSRYNGKAGKQIANAVAELKKLIL